MPMVKIAVILDEQLLHEVDGWVAAGEFTSRSQAIQAALRRLQGERRQEERLLAELTKLDPAEEHALADEHFVADVPRRHAEGEL